MPESLRSYLLFLGFFASSIQVSKVAKGLVLEAESFAKSKQTNTNPQPSVITYENDDILELLSAN